MGTTANEVIFVRPTFLDADTAELEVTSHELCSRNRVYSKEEQKNDNCILK